MRNIISLSTAFIYFTTLFTSFPAFADAQTDRQSIAIKAEKYYELGTKYKDQYPDSAIHYGELQLELAQNLNDHNLKAKAYYILGYAYAQKKIFDVAALHYYKGLEAVKGKEDKYSNFRRAELSSELGYVYEQTYNYDLALQFHSNALNITEKYDLERHAAVLKYSVGVIHRKMGNLSIAREFHHKAINMGQGIQEFDKITDIYISLGNLYFEEELYDSAKYYYNIGLDKYNVDNHDGPKKSILLGNIGECYYQKKNFNQAKAFYDEALKISIKHGDTHKIKWTHFNLAELYHSNGEMNEAIRHYKKCVALEAASPTDKYYKGACKKLSHIYKQQGNYAEALKYNDRFLAQFEKLEELKEDLVQQNARHRMKEVEWQLEKQSQQVKIAKVETENLWVKIIVGLALIVILIASRVIYTYYRKIARAREVLELPYVELDEY